MSRMTGQNSEAAAYEFTTVGDLLSTSGSEICETDRQTAHDSSWTDYVQRSKDTNPRSTRYY